MAKAEQLVEERGVCDNRTEVADVVEQFRVRLEQLHPMLFGGSSSQGSGSRAASPSPPKETPSSRTSTPRQQSDVDRPEVPLPPEVSPGELQNDFRRRGELLYVVWTPPRVRGVWLVSSWARIVAREQRVNGEIVYSPSEGIQSLANADRITPMCFVGLDDSA